MIKDQADLFAGHREAIQLFKKLSERPAGKTWAFLPVLSLVGPAGYGKSAFIEHLYFYYCNAPFLPHISLDFGRRNAPHDLLNILGTLRQSLRRQRDEKGHALAFPRFDIVYARLKRSEGLEDEEIGDMDELFGEFDELIGLVGNIHVALGFLLFILKLIAHIPPLRTFLHWLVEQAYQRTGRQPQWRWYQDQVRKFTEFNLSRSDDVSKIRRRLNEMCTMGEPERQFLINQILPKAFLADLRYGTSETEAVMLKEGPPCVVILLDSFEVLLRNAEPVARQLLELLALNEYRKRGDSDPLLLIVASEERLPDMSRYQLNHHFSSRLDQDGRSIQESANVLHEQWMKHLPAQGSRHALSLKDIYLPLSLPTLTLEAARDYLLGLDQRNETDLFVNEALIEDIYRLTHGYPIFLERVSVALQASIQNPVSGIKNLKDFFFSEQGEQIVDRLLALHCKQVEERTFMLIAIPETLTIDLLFLILKRLRPVLPDANRLNAEWRRYRHLPFLLASEDQQSITFIPGIRALFLKKLQMMSADPDSDYMYMHQLLYDYFNQRIAESLDQRGTRDTQDVLERSYHGLALGNYQPVLQLMIFAQQHEPDLWEDLLQLIGRAPTAKLPYDEVKQQASQALYQAQQMKGVDAVSTAVRSIALYTWLLADPGSERKSVSSLWYELGRAYQCLQAADPSVRHDRAVYCHRRADELLDPALPMTRSFSSLVSTRPLSPGRQNARQLLRGTYRSVRVNRKLQVVLGLILIGALLTWLLALHLALRPAVVVVPDNPFALPLPQLLPDASNQWIGITREPGGDFVGLSDGSIPFDYLRPDGMLKTMAAEQLYQGDSQMRRSNLSAARSSFLRARALLQQATRSDVNDAEALIYQQNIQVYLSARSCVVLVIATRIIEDSSEGVNNGRDNLQGAYLAQKEYNDANPDVPLCLYVANLGISPGSELLVAQQIVHAAQASQGAIKGLIGWSGLLDSSISQAAVRWLEQAHLPIVSPDSYDNAQTYANVFHVAPSRQDQGGQAARYAGQSLHKQRALIITDPADPYSHDLAASFIQRFEEDGHQVVSLQTYTTGQTSAPTLAAELQSALVTHPDMIYFTGGTDEASVLLAQLRADASSLLLLGSERLYPFLGFSVNARPGFTHLAFTSAAYADASATLHLKELYASHFDPQDPQAVREYGYSRPDSEAILSYDAMEALTAAYANAEGLQSLQQALSVLQIVGASRPKIAFTPLNELVDQSMFLLYVDQQEKISSSPL